MKNFTTNNILFRIFTNSRLTQRKFAEDINRDASHLSDWLKSRNELKYSNLEEMANKLGFELEIVVKPIV